MLRIVYQESHSPVKRATHRNHPPITATELTLHPPTGISSSLLVGGELGDGFVSRRVEDDGLAVDELYGYDIAC